MKEASKHELSDIIFLDIETVRLQKNLSVGATYSAWKYKMARYSEEPLTVSYKNTASLYPEFAKIACISVGRVEDNKIIMKSYSGDEKELLSDFCSDLRKFENAKPNLAICGHAVKTFDIPFIFKRSIVHSISPPDSIDISGLKPWELTAIDTKELWKGTSTYSPSLVSVCLALNLETPKSDLSGAEVGGAYFNGEIDRIVKYCEKDVKRTIDVFLKIRLDPIIETVVRASPKEIDSIIDDIYAKGQITKEQEKVILRECKDKEAALKLLKSISTVSDDLENKLK